MQMQGSGGSICVRDMYLYLFKLVFISCHFIAHFFTTFPYRVYFYEVFTCLVCAIQFYMCNNKPELEQIFKNEMSCQEQKATHKSAGRTKEAT